MDGPMEGPDGEDIIDCLLRKQPKQQKLSDDSDDDDEDYEGRGYRKPPESSKDDDSDDDSDDDDDDDDDGDPTYVPKTNEEEKEEEEEEEERRRKEEVKRRRNIPQPSLKAYVNITIPNLWKETLQIYESLKEMVIDGFQEQKITKELAVTIVDILRRRKKFRLWHVQNDFGHGEGGLSE